MHLGAVSLDCNPQFCSAKSSSVTATPALWMDTTGVEEPLCFPYNLYRAAVIVIVRPRYRITLL